MSESQSSSNSRVAETNANPVILPQTAHNFFRNIGPKRWQCVICESNQIEKFITGYKKNLEDHIASIHHDKAIELGLQKRIRSKRFIDAETGELTTVPMIKKIKIDVDINNVKLHFFFIFIAYYV